MGTKPRPIQMRMLKDKWAKLNYLIKEKGVFGSQPHAFKKCFLDYLEQYEAENGEIEV